MTILCEPVPILAVRLAEQIDGPVWTVRGVADVVRALDDHPDDHVVVFGPNADVQQLLGLASRLRWARPTVSMIVVGDPDDPGFQDLTVHSGALEVVSTEDLGALGDACRRARTPVGRVITVYAATGGHGKTTVATNLAVVLSAQSRRVCLVDLDWSFGDMADALGFPPHAAAESLAVTRIRAGLDCVLAPLRPIDPDRTPPEAVGALLAGLADRYDYVVVDTPAQFCGQVLSALDVSYHHVLVATPQRPALRNLRRTLDILDLLAYPRAARTVLLNRCTPHGDLAVADIDTLIRSTIAAHLPDTEDVPASINAGVPLAISAPDHPFVGALRRFASTHVLSDRRNTVRGGGSGAR